MILGWKELIITYSMEQQKKVQDVLVEAGIDYRLKTVNRSSPSPISCGRRAYTGTFSEKINVEIEYIFYVKKNNISLAKALLE